MLSLFLNFLDRHATGIGWTGTGVGGVGTWLVAQAQTPSQSAVVFLLTCTVLVLTGMVQIFKLRREHRQSQREKKQGDTPR